MTKNPITDRLKVRLKKESAEFAERYLVHAEPVDVLVIENAMLHGAAVAMEETLLQDASERIALESKSAK